jgi:signal transduction histidine kinase
VTSSDNIGAAPKNKREKKNLGIQWRLLAYLSAFVLFILVALWVFQIQLLRWFYENIKNQELERTATAIEAVLGDDARTEETVYHYAVEHSTCIQVFRVDGTLARVVASADVSSDCIIHHVTSEYLTALYSYAEQNDGLYTGKVRFHADGIAWADEGGREQTAPDEDVSAIYVRLLKGSDGKRYVVMLDSELTPMSATVSTLKTQFWWIAIALLGGAVVMAYLMSRRVSRPLVRMNESARALARGEYDTVFSGQGYRETRELAQTLNYAAEELSKTDRLQKELIANISHDLRTPLTMIRGYGEVMRDLPGENTPENVQVIIDETDRLSELVSDMLDLSRLQAGTRTLELEVFDLTATVRAVMARYEKLKHHDGYDIRFFAEESVYVRADRTMILQVVYNLINNAINYAGEDRRVDVCQYVKEGHVRLAVRDFGAGIEEAELPLIWDRYYKVDRVHRRAMIGTGLGLSIAKGVLEKHGASYGVRSTPGMGSEFWFELPTATPAVEPTEIKGE